MTQEELLHEISTRLAACNCATDQLDPEQQRELAEMLREASDLMLEDLEEQQEDSEPPPDETPYTEEQAHFDELSRED